MSKRSGGVDIQTNRTSQRGVYFGAWSAYVPGEEHIYEASVRLTKPSRCFVLDADAFARVHAVTVPDGRPPARGPQGRRPAAAPDHRPAREAAGARHHHRGPHPPAQQPGRGDRARGRRPPRGRRPHAAQAGDARRRQVHARRPARAGQHPGRGRRAGRQVQDVGADRAGGLRPRGPDRRLARGPRHRRRLGLRADVRRRRASTPTGSSASRRRSTTSTPRRRCRARSDG